MTLTRLRSRETLINVAFLFLVLVTPAAAYAQAERQAQPPQDEAYGARFFEQLQRLFGRFRDADLQRAFQTAEPIPCSELVVDRGEWREVAFFNDNRKLGDWYRSNLEEVKTDLAVFVFSGACTAERSPVQLTTRFPITESIDAYNDGKINFRQIAINVNAPVTAVFDPQTRAYTFDLPYLFLMSRENGTSIFSLFPRRLAERDKFDQDVTNHWDCKAVRGADVTYQFLICRTTTLDRDLGARNQNRNLAFGAAAYSILSDGNEAFSTVKLSFGDAPEVSPPAAKPADVRPPTLSPVGSVWQPADSRLAVADVGEGEFRLRFSPQPWTGKVGSPQVLSNQMMSSLASAKPQERADYCIWLPGGSVLSDRLLTQDPDEYVSYSVKALNKEQLAAASIIFEMKTHTGVKLGTLQCYFPRAESPASIGVDRWASIVGSYLSLEVIR